MEKAKALDILRDYMREHGAELGIREIGIFGSTARGDATQDSDVDIVVDIDPPRFLTLVRIQSDLKEKLGAKVDLIRKRDDLSALLKSCIDEEAVYA